jgi:thioredoxin reductase (NADPH)
VTAAPNVEVLLCTEVVALEGGEMLERIRLRDRRTKEERTFDTHWLFVCIGGVPQTQWAAEVDVIRDGAGYLVTGPDLMRGRRQPDHWPLDRDPYYLETNIPGVFAAGDVRHESVKRFASAVGEGAMAVAFVHRYLAQG